MVYRGGAGVPTVGLGVAGLPGGCLGGRSEARAGLPGGGGGRFTGVALLSAGALTLGGASTMAGTVSPFLMFPSANLLPLGMEDEGHFETEDRASSSFFLLKNARSSSSVSAETDC